VRFIFLSQNLRIGVYICHCGLNISGVVDVKEAVTYAGSLPGVVIAKDHRYACADLGQALIKKDIQEYALDRIVVASCSPRMHESTFRRVLEEADLNPYLLEMVNIREQCSWVHIGEPEKATEKAKSLIRMAIVRSRLLKPLEIKEVEVLRSVLIIGGGIAGMNAALDLAEIGFKVYLVEKSESLGGNMTKLDKTFPTMDCSICIEGPKMVDVFRHPNIEVFSLAEVISLGGFVGNFTVKVLKHPRYVIAEQCTGCGECEAVCPIEIPNKWGMNLDVRRAISIPFPQAVPLIYTRNKDHCFDCYKCVDVCGERNAIDFNQKSEVVELNVGALIVAIGYEFFNPSSLNEYGYGSYSNVISSIEMERLLNAAGPTRGKLFRASDGKVPHRIGFIQCVGSRDERIGQLYCSNACCLNSIKLAQQIKEKHPETEIYIFYNDIRAFGKGFEEVYKKARESWITFVRGIPSEVMEEEETRNLKFVVQDQSLGKLVEFEMDLVTLAIGMVPQKSAKSLSKVLHIPLSSDGFFLEAHSKIRPVDTHTAGIFLAGTCQGPKNIHESVSQGKASASSVAALLSKGKIRVESTIAHLNQDLCIGCGLCEEACPYDAVRTEDGKSLIMDVLCRGCGVCASSCPEHAIMMMHFTDEEVLAQVITAFQR
jgi:heterodisulfide reductase subunit A